MEFLLIPLVVGAVAFCVWMAAYGVGWLRKRRRGAAFQDYVAEHLPDLQMPSEMLCAARQSKGPQDVALLVAEDREEIIVLLDGGRDGMSHIAFPCGSLTGVDSASRIISRGVPTSRVYSYEQAMTVRFSDGSAISLYLEMPSNKRGTDRAPALVGAMFAPWHAKLNAVLGVAPSESHHLEFAPPSKRSSAVTGPGLD